MKTSIATIQRFEETKNPLYSFVYFSKTLIMVNNIANVVMFDRQLVSADERVELEALMSRKDIKSVTLEAYHKGHTPV